MTRSNRSLLYIALTLFLAIIPYLNTLDKSFSFVYDDIDLIPKNQNIRNLSLEFIKNSFADKNIYNTAAGDIYRPFYIILYAVEYQLWNLNPTGYHVVNLLLHAANALVVYLLLCSLLSNRNISLFGAILFAIHPVHTENVAWIKETTTLLSSLFMFSALFCYLRYREFKASRYLLISIMLFSFSLLSKETSIVFPLLIAMIDIYLFKRDALQRGWGSWILNFAIALLFLWARTAVLGQIAQQEYYYGGSFKTTLFTMFRVIAYYLKLLVFPINLCGDYLQYPLSYDFDMLVAASAGLLVIFLIVALWQIRKNPLISLGIAFFFLTLLPVLNIVPVKILIAERFLYLPSFGLILSVSAFINARTWDHKIKNGRVLLFIILIMLFSILTYKRNFAWQSQYTFWSDVVKEMPENSKAHYNLALSQPDIDVRVKELRTALYLNPTDDLARSKLATALSQKGDYDLAVELYMDILKRNPSDVKALNSLARMYFTKGDYKNAKDIFEKLIASDPNNPQILNNLGSVYDMLKEYDKAVNLFNRTLAYDPNNIETYYSLGIAYNRKGRYKEAEVIYRKALNIDKISEKAHFGLGETYFNMGDYSGATVEFKKAIDVNPINPDAYYNLAYIYAFKGDSKASMDWLEKAINSGFKDTESLKREKVFAPLRGNEKFKKLIP